MSFVKQNWNFTDILQFKEYEKSLKSTLKDCAWEQRIVNTKLECFGKTSFKAKQLAKEIKKGNSLSFIENMKIENHLESLLVGYLICNIKNFNLFSNKLEEYVLTIDNWASCDCLKFSKYNKEDLIKLSYKYLNSKHCFVRRVGVNFWFEIIKNENYVDDCFKFLNCLQNEQEYYVNMCGAWLLAEVFTKYKQKAVEYFKNNTTNNFVINKAISKCRDSFRVSREDKDFLLQFKRK